MNKELLARCVLSNSCVAMWRERACSDAYPSPGRRVDSEVDFGKVAGADLLEDLIVLHCRKTLVFAVDHTTLAQPSTTYLASGASFRLFIARARRMIISV